MVVQLIVVLIIIVLGLYIVGVGSDFFSDISASFNEKVKKQAEVFGESTTVEAVFEKANLAEDTGTRICDLEIIFVGDVTDFETGVNLQGGIESFIGFDRFIFFGQPTDFASALLSPGVPADKDIFEYTWLCDTAPAVAEVSTSISAMVVTDDTTVTADPIPLVGEGSTGGSEICRTGARGIQVCESLSIFTLLSWNLGKNTQAGIDQLSLLGQETAGEVIRVNFIGPSKTRTSFNLWTPDFPNLGIEEAPFTKSFTLGTGEEFPVAYRIKLNLDDVTEDNYKIEFWYETFPANNKPVGTHFFKDLCKPGLSTC